MQVFSILSIITISSIITAASSCKNNENQDSYVASNYSEELVLTAEEKKITDVNREVLLRTKSCVACDLRGVDLKKEQLEGGGPLLCGS